MTGNEKMAIAMFIAYIPFFCWMVMQGKKDWVDVKEERKKSDEPDLY